MWRAASGLLAVLVLGGCSDGFRDSEEIFRVGETVEVGDAPHGIRFSRDGDTAYVALSGDGQIAVVDLEAGAVVDRWEAGENPLDLIATPDGWLVSQFRDSVLLRLDSDGAIRAGEPLRVGPGASLFTPDPVGGRTWITAEFADHLVEVDLSEGSVLDTFPTGIRPYPGDVMWDGSHIFVPSLEDGTVSVIDLLNRETDTTVVVCAAPPGGGITPDHINYLVACGGSDQVAVLNTAAFRVVRRIEEGLGPRPFSVTATADGRHAVVNNAGGSTVSVIDLADRRVVQRLEVGDQPIVMRRHPDGRRIFVSNERSGTLVALEPVAPVARTRRGELNEVVVLGMIHGDHETSERYGLDVVRELVRAIDPDYWLVEIPPNRWRRARREYAELLQVDEPRVRRFPEYTAVLLPLSRTMDFQVIPTAGWTRPMSDFRSARLDAIADDPSRRDDWEAYRRAVAAADSAIRAGGEPDDPRWIHSDAYDEAQELRLGVYERLFGEELGPGGWERVNQSHWSNIARALERHSGEGARILITYGAGHKGWLLRALRDRTDIRILDVGPFLEQIGR